MIIRSYSVTILIILTIIVVAVLCKYKFDKHPDEIAEFEKSMKGIEKMIPADKAFSLQLIHTNPVLQFYTRYYMAPRHMYYPKAASDTILYICDIHDIDSVTKSTFINKKILWNNHDNKYSYTLISSN